MTADRSEEKANAEVALDLVAALGHRADEVGVEPTPQARAAVDRRRRRRARRRQVRRGMTTAALVVAVGASVAVLQRDPAPNVVAGPDEPPPEWCDQPLRPGQTGDDPAPLGLPRLVFDASAGLTPALPATPLATVEEDTESVIDHMSVQVFSRPDELVPLIVAPWSAGRELDLPVPGEGNEAVEVGDIPAALTETAGGWATLAWTMDDGSEVWLSAYAIERSDLLRVAAGLRRPDSGEPGYSAGYLPPDFTDSQVDLSTDADGYYGHFGYDSATTDGVGVRLDLFSEQLPESGSPLEAVLGEAVHAEPVDVLGTPGILAEQANGTWTIAWSAGKCLASVRIDSLVPRPRVEAILAALHVADDAEWAAFLATRSTPGR